MKILAGIDGTDRGDHAVEFVSGLLNPQTDSVWFYYSPPKLRPVKADEPALTKFAQESLAKAVFDKAAGQLAESLRPSEQSRIVGEREPCEGILAAAAENQADLIVIGAHSSTRRLKLFVGGTARKIAHSSDVPVLLVREKQQTPSDEFRVLVLCGNNDDWRKASNALAKFSWPKHTDMTLFHVVESMTEARAAEFAESAKHSVANADKLIDEYRTSIEQQRTTMRTSLDSDRDALPAALKAANTKVTQGHAVESVVEEVEEQNIDLVVVSARKLGRIGRLLGSTTEGLLTQCPCSLLIVHNNDHV